MKCPNCQAELRESARFCGICGHSAQSQNTCKSCGEVNPPDYKFCDKCGQPLLSAISQITQNAAHKILNFNNMKRAPRYNNAANKIYSLRYAKKVDPFGQQYLQSVIKGLVAFDMGRWCLGEEPTRTDDNFFGFRLNAKLDKIKPDIQPLMGLNLTEISINQYKDDIIEIYTQLASQGQGQLDSRPKRSFHVGATKILHFLNPKLFIIVDSNASRSYKKAFGINYRNTTQPGYTAGKYIQCMTYAQKDINSFGIQQFNALEQNTPITRIYDKLTFMTGKK